MFDGCYNMADLIVDEVGNNDSAVDKVENNGFVDGNFYVVIDADLDDVEVNCEHYFV